MIRPGCAGWQLGMLAALIGLIIWGGLEDGWSPFRVFALVSMSFLLGAGLISRAIEVS